jgi:hypothetical protein
MRHALVLLAALFTANAVAQSASTDASLRSLSSCDATFFKLLTESQATFSGYAPLTRSNSPTAFVVPNRQHPTESRVMFKQPMRIAGLEVIGYFDEIVNYREGMSAYSWGYLVANTVEASATALIPIIWDSERLRKDGPIYVRSEVWSHDKPAQGWVKVATEAGLPKRGTVERVFMIEPYDGESKFIRVGCSLQGNVIDPIVRDLRPDLR